VIWTTPAETHPAYLEFSNTLEYLLEISDDRIIAYVDELTWSNYLMGKADAFKYSTLPQNYAIMSILVACPIRKHEVKAIRRYRLINGQGHYELASETVF
jgi:hypothetical protein